MFIALLVWLMSELLVCFTCILLFTVLSVGLLCHDIVRMVIAG